LNLLEKKLTVEDKVNAEYYKELLGWHIENLKNSDLI